MRAESGNWLKAIISVCSPVLMSVIILASIHYGLGREISTKATSHHTGNTETDIVKVIPDFSMINDLMRKKLLFFGFMRPIVEAENEYVLRKRERLLELDKMHHNGIPLSLDELAFIEHLAVEYRVKVDGDYNVTIQVLKRRVDMVPIPLALIQAAKESGWGTSRFARLGNNMFGQWCFSDNCGIIPFLRGPEDNYEVATFESVNESVRSYIHNLNTGEAYSFLRSLRYRQRETGMRPDSYTLINGLIMYSERRDDYIEEIRTMLRINMPLISSS